MHTIDLVICSQHYRLSGMTCQAASHLPRACRRSLAQLGPWDRHKLLLQQRMPSGSALASLVPKSDADFLREHHEFIRGDGGAVAADSTWGERLAAHYYGKLLKEYALCDLSCYKEGKVGLRWRTEQEVVTGKGQFTCAALTCGRDGGLQSYELPFAYQEKGHNKQACLTLAARALAILIRHCVCMAWRCLRTARHQVWLRR